jgi:hypothetical protein
LLELKREKFTNVPKITIISSFAPSSYIRH